MIVLAKAVTTKSIGTASNIIDCATVIIDFAKLLASDSIQ